jgi:glycosyltransferase involved in cell wall biosynthesis
VTTALGRGDTPRDVVARKASHATVPNGGGEIRLRVAAIIDTKIVSGPGRQLAALATSLAARNVDLQIVAIQRQGVPLSPYIGYLRDCGVAHVVVYESGRGDLALVRRVGRALADFRADVLETHGYKATAVAAALRLWKPRWKWAAFWHGATSEDWKVQAYVRIDKSLIRFADHIVTMSKQQKALFPRAGSKVSVIWNAVLPHQFASGQPQAVAGPEVARPLLGVVGRLSPEKGVDVFLRGAALLRDRGVPFSAIIVGDGPERATLEALSNELQLTSHVRFLGSRADVDAIYKAIDVLVIPSRSEGLPNVLLEALSHDRSVVATRVGAIPDVIDSERAGTLVDPDDPSALADGIVEAAAGLAEPAAIEARRQVVARFSLPARVDAHIRLYASLLGASPSSPLCAES